MTMTRSSTRRPTTPPPGVLSPHLFLAVAALSVQLFVRSEPISHPYVAFRTNPFEQTKGHTGQDTNFPNVKLDGSRGPNKRGSRGRTMVRPVEVSPAGSGSGGGGGGATEGAATGNGGDPRCPLALRVGLTHRTHSSSSSATGTGTATSLTLGGTGMHAPAVTWPAHPSSGPGREVIYSTDWEHLDMLTPSTQTTNAGDVVVSESLSTDAQFPLLFEGANFRYSQPILHDVNGDGIMDATLIDYDGGIYTVGLDYSPPATGGGGAAKRRERYVKTGQVPRLYLRKDWVESATNVTEPGPDEPESYGPKYHSYFEYGTEWKEDADNARLKGGMSADVVDQSIEQVEMLERRREDRMREEEEEERRKEEEKKRKEEEAAAAAEAAEKGEEGEENKKKNEENKEEAEEKGQNAEEKGGDEKNENKEEEVQDEKVETVEGEGDAVRGDRRRRLQEEAEADAGADTGTDADAPPESAEKPQEEPEQEVINAIHVGKASDVVGEAAAPRTDGEEECGDCYGAGEEGECCNTCEEVTKAYRKKNWGYKNADFVQCVREGKLNDTDADAGLYNSGYGADDDAGVHDDVARAGGMGEHGDDEYAYGDDEYAMRRRYGYGDDMYPPEDDYYGGYRGAHDNFYSDENYLRVPPHVVSTPIHVEVPKRYKAADDNDYSAEQYLIVAASYYLDEDEFAGAQRYRRFKNTDGGDETETQRGQFVASAILFYSRQYDQWSAQTHLDLSTDYTAPLNTTVGNAPIHDDPHNGYGAFALASPTVASFELETLGTNPNQPKYSVIVGTSMGLLYVLDVPSAMRRGGFPIRFPYPILRRAVVEDVLGDTKPEIIAMDAGGNVACLDDGGGTLWHRDLIEAEREKWVVRGTSEMTMGDVDGDGILDVVLTVRLSIEKDFAGGGWDNALDEMRIYALDATSGDDLPRYPMSVEVHRRPGDRKTSTPDDDLPLPQPLLVDLHATQGHWLDRVRKFRNVTSDPRPELEREARRVREINDKAAKAAIPDKNAKVPHGGMGRGLHIVQPIQSHLYIIEGGTGCAQTINIGDDVHSMVQVDDVHATDTLDLIVSTASGQVLTLEVSDAVPFHPLNVWNTGGVRSRVNGHAQGYSASSGIFVHDKSRRYKNWLGIYVTVTFEIFDVRPNIWKEPEQRKYLVDIRCGTSSEKVVMRQVYTTPGVYTERIFIPYGTGYYTLSARLTTTNGLIYEDVFSIGYNVNYSTGFAWVVLLPLVLSAIPLLSIRRKPNWEEDDDFTASGRARSHGILG